MCRPNLALPEADFCIDIMWYRHFSDTHKQTLCHIMRTNPPRLLVRGRT